jgi:hypothetical protein
MVCSWSLWCVSLSILVCFQALPGRSFQSHTPIPLHGKKVMSCEDTTQGRKRPLETEGPVMDADPAFPSIMDDFPSSISKLRLEAIFHPKFDNEHQRDHSVRSTMNERIAQGSGYLEVTVKHSGSLLLWSGGQRFYSKNSADNQFTLAGEILLRQHFVRAFWADRELNANDIQAAFQSCSDYIQLHRLTLAFEVVTSFLGDHGDRPKRDFLILTAVADRNDEHFFSTTETIQLAHRFRLPHNDAWIFASTASTNTLFDFYDTVRETGMATTVISALSLSADVHVSSMYPHDKFQGEIMEGIVIRYVPCPDRDEALAGVKALAEVSLDLLVRIPPVLASCPTLVQLDEQSLPVLPAALCCDIRAMYEAAPDTSLEARLRDILASSEASRDVQRTERKKDIDVALVLKPLTESMDRESRRIAQLVQTLSSLNSRVEFLLFKEQARCGGGEKRVRWLCTVHVKNDKTFQTFRRVTADDATVMDLFRGFVFQLLVNASNDDRDADDELMNRIERNATRSIAKELGSEPLMLKMKFLPYMVRTFGCRNGLATIKRGGPSAFSLSISEMLSRWGISQPARTKWQPYLDAWGVYAHRCLNGQVPSDGSTAPPKLQLSDKNYLAHLAYFDKIYHFGAAGHCTSTQLNQERRCIFQGVVVVVSPLFHTASLVADFIADKLGGARRIDGSTALTRELHGGACGPGKGIVIAATLEEGPGRVRRCCKDKAIGDNISLVLFQMSDIETNFPNMEKANRGIVSSWQKTRCAKTFELPFAALFSEKADSKDDFRASDEILSMIDALSKATAARDERPGLLVFFPGIPGCGKSCLTGQESLLELRQALLEMNPKQNQRNLTVLVGDQLGKKYWQAVKGMRQRDSAGVFVADKNAPLSALGNIAAICAETLGVGVPVLPNDLALQTTEVIGIRSVEGKVIDERKHFYPFSLAFLAVCMARVMDRPAGTHEGKLDIGTRRACMIVVKFYAFYRGVSAEDIIDRVKTKFDSSGALLCSPIKVPFFKAGSGQLPFQLEQVLTHALRVQVRLCEAVSYSSHPCISNAASV